MPANAWHKLSLCTAHSSEEKIFSIVINPPKDFIK